MNKITDITENFGTLYHPVAALVIYASNKESPEMYVEHFEMDSNGHPINAHPLTVKEANLLAKTLLINTKEERSFLKPKGILPMQILHVDQEENSTVIWYTKSRTQQLYFVNYLGIPCGNAHIPSMLWIANKEQLSVFALNSNNRPTEQTALYYAPFFNVYEDGNVCMGTVDININDVASLEEFTAAWENYFFNSYFSHLVGNYNPVIGNCVSLWKTQIETGELFPKEVLKKNNRTLKSVLSWKQ